LFTGSKYNIKYPKLQYPYLTTSSERLYNIGKDPTSNEEEKDIFKIISVTDNVPIVAIDHTIFKSVIGSEAEAYRFSYINEEHCAYRRNLSLSGQDNNSENRHDFNLVRGIYSPYLGIVSNKEHNNNYCKLFNIYYPGTFTNEGNLNSESLFTIRINNNSAYYPITSINKLEKDSSSEIYNGDCFLCTFTHRVNRNFNDQVAPTNDHILDSETWQKNYDPDTTASNEKSKGIEKLNQINRGDVNAVKLGSWITIRVKASYNLSIRSLDESHLQEKGIMGRARGFYPLQ